MRRLAVIGAGWAGLAAAVEAVDAGWAVSVHEMAPQPGGRARQLRVGERVLDNGQHILIGAYLQTLRLMRRVGVDPDRALLRTPLRLVEPDGRGLRLPAGPATPAFLRAVLARAGWPLRERLGLLVAAARWRLQGFRCGEGLTVAQLTEGLGPAVQRELIEPLCVAALNTPAGEASGVVFLRVLRDALFEGPGSADLLLPRVDLGKLFPLAAWRWLGDRGARLALTRRVRTLARDGDAWRIDDEPADAVVLAVPPGEAARLAADVAPAWSATAAGLSYEPIVTVYLHGTGARLPEAMLALPGDADANPAQFVFDRGRLGGDDGLLAFVISGAQRWVERGTDATEQAVRAQAERDLGPFLRGPLAVVQTVVEKRATFRCTPSLRRPPTSIAPGLVAAGDHVAGPYPATLEGAVISAVSAVRSLS